MGYCAHTMVVQKLLSFLGLTRRRPSPTICNLSGCSRPCYEEPSGRVHDFCRRSHALQALNEEQQQHSRAMSSSAAAAATAAAAPADGFDPTLECRHADVVLFWQPPSVFSQWTPSKFFVEDVSEIHSRTHRLSCSCWVNILSLFSYHDLSRR